MTRYIDADALLENLKLQYGEELGWQCTVNMSDVGMMIENAPTADVAPRAEWISVEERLPDRNGVFLVALKESGYENLVYFDVRPYADGEWRNLPGKLTVSHWMPIPNPPKGE